MEQKQEQLCRDCTGALQVIDALLAVNEAAGNCSDVCVNVERAALLRVRCMVTAHKRSLENVWAMKYVERRKAAQAQLRRMVDGYLSQVRVAPDDAADFARNVSGVLDEAARIAGLERENKRLAAVVEAAQEVSRCHLMGRIYPLSNEAVDDCDALDAALAALDRSGDGGSDE